MTEISKEYAEALLLLAVETGEERAYLSAMESAASAIGENPEYAEFLSSPSIPLRERLASVESVFGAEMPEHVVSLICLLCEKGRIALFDACVEDYRTLLHAREAIVTATVTSAVPLTEEEQCALKEKLEKMSGNTVLPTYSVDPSILGGVVVEMDGKVTDGSLRHRLREVKEVMNR